jgi:hypothetical protein
VAQGDAAQVIQQKLEAIGRLIPPPLGRRSQGSAEDVVDAGQEVDDDKR